MEARIAKLESDVGHIKSDISDIRLDIKDLRNSHDKDFRILVGMQFTTILGVLGLLVKVFA